MSKGKSRVFYRASLMLFGFGFVHETLKKLGARWSQRDSLFHNLYLGNWLVNLNVVCHEAFFVLFCFCFLLLSAEFCLVITIHFSLFASLVSLLFRAPLLIFWKKTFCSRCLYQLALFNWHPRLFVVFWRSTTLWVWSYEHWKIEQPQVVLSTARRAIGIFPTSCTMTEIQWEKLVALETTMCNDSFFITENWAQFV